MNVALLFLLTGLAEIGGGWLVWQYIREGKPFYYAVLGAIIMIVYAILPTLQTYNFSRIYAAYGGAFIFLSLLWGLFVDGQKPDHLDIIGALICLVGATVMLLPRAT